MADPRTYQFDLPSDGRPTDVTLAEFWYPGIQQFWEASTSRRIFDPSWGSGPLFCTPPPAAVRMAPPP